MPAEDRPDIKFLNCYVRSHICGACDFNSELWKDLGIELMGQAGVNDLNIISANKRGDVIQCCSSMFSLWLERQPEASWKQLIMALIKIQLNHLASEIKKSLKAEQSQNSEERSLEGTYIAQDVTKSFKFEKEVEISMAVVLSNLLIGLLYSTGRYIVY